MRSIIESCVIDLNYTLHMFRKQASLIIIMIKICSFG